MKRRFLGSSKKEPADSRRSLLDDIIGKRDEQHGFGGPSKVEELIKVIRLQYGDREVTMEDFLELEEWLEDMDQNSKKKLDDDQHTSRGDLETSPKASIDRHQPDGIDRQPPHIIDQRPPYIID
ncbi:hypothetical protein F2Q70_00003847 [Brassica cretica]|uniref:Uncharacterized protein n=1 Tax=Brassica cretica TaxID=69181 RepID=A0A8S9ILR9_BRACR|nr:hypothetical protein F2Q70_00003847 [Brassica cretica]